MDWDRIAFEAKVLEGSLDLELPISVSRAYHEDHVHLMWLALAGKALAEAVRAHDEALTEARKPHPFPENSRLLRLAEQKYHEGVDALATWDAAEGGQG